MCDAGFSHKQRISIHYLKDNAASWPYINLSIVSGGSKDEFRSTIASSTDIRNIILIWNEYFSWSKVADSCFVAFKKDVFRLNVPMANIERMEIG